MITIPTICLTEVHLSLTVSSVTVILICERSTADVAHLDRLMDQVWDAIVLCVGVDDLANMTNVEKVKRQLKVGIGQSCNIDYIIFWSYAASSYFNEFRLNVLDRRISEAIPHAKRCLLRMSWT